MLTPGEVALNCVRAASVALVGPAVRSFLELHLLQASDASF